MRARSCCGIERTAGTGCAGTTNGIDCFADAMGVYPPLVFRGVSVLQAPVRPAFLLLRLSTLAFQLVHLSLIPNACFSDQLRRLDLSLSDPRLKRLPRDADRVRSLFGGVELVCHREDL